VQVDGDVDLTTVDQLGATLDIAVAKGVRQLIVDLRGVSFLGSDGLTCLADAAQHAEATGCRLYTIATQPVVVRTIEVTGLAPALRLRGDPVTVPPPCLDHYTLTPARSAQPARPRVHGPRHRRRGTGTEPARIGTRRR
jgi:anti-sigma B factor antagonist